MLNTQQILVMMPLLHVNMPASAGIFFTSIMEIAAFDFYDFTNMIHDNMNLEPSEIVNVNFSAIGFESKYFLVNMGTLAAIFLVYFGLILLSPFLWAIRNSCRCMKRSSKWLKGKLFWNSLITIVQESYMIFIVCILINLKVLNFIESFGLALMSVMCVAAFAFTILFPGYLLCKLCYYGKKLKQKTIVKKYGNLYEELKLKAGKKVLLYPSFFFIRRYLIALAITGVDSIFIWQLTIMVGQVLLQI